MRLPWRRKRYTGPALFSAWPLSRGPYCIVTAAYNGEDKLTITGTDPFGSPVVLFDSEVS